MVEDDGVPSGGNPLEGEVGAGGGGHGVGEVGEEKNRTPQHGYRVPYI